MSDCGESLAFRSACLIGSGVLIAYSAWQLSILNRIRSSTATSVPSDEFNWAFYITILILIFSIVFFLWAAYRLLFTRKFREKKAQQVGELLTVPAGSFAPFAGEEVTETIVTKKTYNNSPRPVGNVRVRQTVNPPPVPGRPIRPAPPVPVETTTYTVTKPANLYLPEA